MLAETESKNQLHVWYSMETEIEHMRQVEGRYQTNSLERWTRSALASIAWSFFTNESATSILKVPRIEMGELSIQNMGLLDEYIGSGGTGVIYANHVSALDVPYMIAAGLKFAGSNLNVAAAPTAVKHMHGVKGAFYEVLRHLGAIPIPVVNISDDERAKADDAGLSQRDALRAAYIETINAVLRGEGNLVGIFPQGTRKTDGNLGGVQKGLGNMHLQNPRTLFLPVGIRRTKNRMELVAERKPFFVHELFPDGIPSDAQVVADTLWMEVVKLLS